MVLSGTNKFCQQCVKECKQWAQVKVIRCPYFLSGQKDKFKKYAETKKGDTLALGKKAVEGC